MLSAPAERRQAGCNLFSVSSLPGGRRGEAQLRTKFFAKLSFKKACGRRGEAQLRITFFAALSFKKARRPKKERR